VDPDTDLVDGQEVHVTGDGFTVVEPGFGGYAQIDQCVIPAIDVATDCDRETGTGGGVDLQGHLDATVDLEAVLHLRGGVTHDCRTGGCGLLVRDYDEPAVEGALVPLDYDPDGPLRPVPTLVADPDTDLVDGDLVHLTGSGWEEGAVGLLQCRAAPANFDQCDFGTFESVEATETGDVDDSVRADAVLHVGRGREVDCRVEACSLVATQDESFRHLVEVPLGFDPDARLVDIAITVSPSTGLHDGDRVQVTGEGRGDAEMLALQCVGHATTWWDCDFEGATTIGNGDDLEAAGPDLQPFSARVTVVRELHLANGDVVDCTLTPCSLVVAEDPNFVVAGRASLEFARVDAVPGPVIAAPPFTG
jgi:hypothetical protein